MQMVWVVFHGVDNELIYVKDSSHMWRLRTTQRIDEITGSGPGDSLGIQPKTPLSDHNTLVATDSNIRTEWNLSDARIPCCNEEHKDLGMDGTSDGHAQFHGLSRQEREHVGCIEYQALRFLSYLVPSYYIAWQFFGFIGLGAYISHKKTDATGINAVNPWYFLRSHAVPRFANPTSGG